MRVATEFFLCFLLTGCAQLSVEVDVLDPVVAEIILEDGALKRLYYKIVSESDADVDESISALRAQHAAANEALASFYDNMASGEIDPRKKQLLQVSAADLRAALDSGTPLDRLYQELAREIKSANEAILVIAKRRAPQESQPLEPDLRRALSHRRDVERLAKAPILSNLLDAEKDAQVDSQLPSSKRFMVAVAIAKDALTSVTGGGVLTNSEYAYPVASADEKYWATKFNHALGKATFGDADIVIKMGQQGDFTVKGMQFDPSTVAAVASKVTTQSLLLAAQIAGVPVSSKSLSDSSKSTGFAGTGDNLISIDQKLAEREARVVAWKAAVRDLAQSILTEEIDLTKGTSEDRAAAGKALRAIYDAHKTTLKLENLN